MLELLKEVVYYLVGVAIEGGNKIGGWKGYIFMWPFTLAFVIIIYLITRIFIAY